MEHHAIAWLPHLSYQMWNRAMEERWEKRGKEEEEGEDEEEEGVYFGKPSQAQQSLSI